MEQFSLFKEAGQSAGLPKELLEYHPDLFSVQESDFLLDKFIRETPWQIIRFSYLSIDFLFPKTHLAIRLLLSILVLFRELNPPRKNYIACRLSA
jgi:hypothetical protein